MGDYWGSNYWAVAGGGTVNITYLVDDIEVVIEDEEIEVTIVTDET